MSRARKRECGGDGWAFSSQTPDAHYGFTVAWTLTIVSSSPGDLLIVRLVSGQLWWGWRQLRILHLDSMTAHTRSADLMSSIQNSRNDLIPRCNCGDPGHSQEACAGTVSPTLRFHIRGLLQQTSHTTMTASSNHLGYHVCPRIELLPLRSSTRKKNITHYTTEAQGVSSTLGYTDGFHASHSPRQQYYRS